MGSLDLSRCIDRNLPWPRSLEYVFGVIAKICGTNSLRLLFLFISVALFEADAL
jgi:hypothetical protein